MNPSKRDRGNASADENTRLLRLSEKLQMVIVSEAYNGLGDLRCIDQSPSAVHLANEVRVLQRSEHDEINGAAEQLL